MKSILGGGIGGLSAAYYLNRKYPSELIKLFESQNSTGGWIRSIISPSGNMFEQGPRTLRPNGKAGLNTLLLVDELGLSDKIVPIHANHPAAKTRMIYANGNLHTLPSSLAQMFRQTSPFSKPLVSYLLNDLTAKPKMSPINDESIYDFVERRFGKDIAQYAISPMICGICAGDAKQISVKFLMKSIYDNEQKYGGVIKGMVYDWWANRQQGIVEDSSSLIDVAKNEKWSIYSFEGGMERLTSTLVHHLENQHVDFLLNKHCDQIDFIGGDTAVLSIDGHSQETITNQVISSLPASKLGDLVQHQHPELAALLKQIPVVTVAVVNLCYKSKIPLKSAFGFLVPPTENLPILGVIFDSCCFPSYNDATVLTVMMGGHWFQKLFGDDPKEEYLLETAVQQMRHILNIVIPPDDYKVSILHECIPQYIVGHFDRVANIENYIKTKKLPLSICGSSYYGVGVNDVILSAKNAVDAL